MLRLFGPRVHYTVQDRHLGGDSTDQGGTVWSGAEGKPLRYSRIRAKKTSFDSSTNSKADYDRHGTN